MGRKSTYSEKVADQICERLAAGESLNAICKDEGFPAESTVRDWALDDVQGFAAKYTRAREAQADFYAQQIVDIADEQGEVLREDGSKFDPDVNRDRLRIDARKWFASKVAPKKYGDKTDVTISGNMSLSQMSDEELTQRARAA